MEVFDLYDRNFNKLEKTMERGSSNNPGEYHLVVHIWFRNSEGKYLIQQRNKLTDLIPFQWAATGGAAISGDTSIEAAVRETKEELGIDVEPSKFKLLKRYFIDGQYHTNYITDLYLVEEDISLNDIEIDLTEVKDVAYKTLEEIKQMIKNNQFWDYENKHVRKGYFDQLEKSC